MPSFNFDWMSQKIFKEISTTIWRLTAITWAPDRDEQLSYICHWLVNGRKMFSHEHKKKFSHGKRLIGMRSTPKFHCVCFPMPLTDRLSSFSLLHTTHPWYRRDTASLRVTSTVNSNSRGCVCSYSVWDWGVRSKPMQAVNFSKRQPCFMTYISRGYHGRSRSLNRHFEISDS